MLIGFDARENSLEFSATWDAERRRLFLLRQDIEKPLSVDAVVWPSAFDLEHAPRPQWTGYVQDLWGDLYALTRATADFELPVQYAAFEVLNPSSSSPAEMSWRERVLNVEPSSVDEVRWTLVGYDVADYYLLSALTNCGYTGEDRRRAACWIPRLNKNHLFESPEDAFEFRREADERVPEHAPFFVFGIWLLPVGSWAHR